MVVFLALWGLSVKLPQSVERNQLVHLTGFRAIAAYFVLLAHSANVTFTYGGVGFAQPYVNCLAFLGMSIFFVLSGFVITYAYYDRFIQLPWRHAVRDFTVARFARLYPLYVLFHLCDPYQRYALFSGTFGEQVSFFTLTQTWWNMENVTFEPAWSISTECFFYLCFALWMLIPTATRCAAVYVRCIAIITLAGIFLILAATFSARTDITTFLSPILSRSSNTNIWAWFRYYSPYVRIGEFIAGVCAARIFMVTRHDEHLPADQQRASVLCIGCGVAIVSFMIINVSWSSPDNFLFFLSLNFGYAPFLAYIFYACSRYPNLLTRWCSTRFMQTGGDISYSVYICQIWVYNYVIRENVAEGPSPFACEISLLKMILYVILTTIIALSTYRFIEVPSRRFLRN